MDPTARAGPCEVFAAMERSADRTAPRKTGEGLKVLVVDDEPLHAEAVAETLRRVGYDCTVAASGQAGARRIEQDEYDVILTDLKMADLDGLALLRKAQEELPEAKVILITGHGDVKTAVEAMQNGAAHYLTKPVDMAELRAIVDKVSESIRLARANRELQRRLDEKFGFEGVVGNSPKMHEVIRRLQAVAPTDSTLLILGATGPGKDPVARAIPNNSPPKNKPFVPMNCTALNENLLDDELFGHEAHSFTGADKMRKGRFEYANGGTLFLDEVGDMPINLQAKLLRVLENKEVFRIGSNEPIKVNVRVVAATHRDLEKLVEEGKFRQDLYYRLGNLKIHLPPLRQRGSDLEFLAEHFLAQAAKEAGRPVPALHPQTLERLRTYPWPGNGRQLQHVLPRAFLVWRGAQILAADLELADRASGSAVSERPDVAEQEAITGLCQAIRWAWGTQRMSLWPLLRDMLERELLKFALAEMGGNQTQVADRLN